MKKVLSIFLIIILLCSFLCGCIKPDKASVLENSHIENAGLVVHFIDVGQGDSMLIESCGEFALIDGGEYAERHAVISYLSQRGVTELNFIISTHPHSDHCGGLSEVIRNFTTTSLICPDVHSESASWEYVLDAADERGVEYITPNPSDTFRLGESTLTILSPATNSVYSNMNDYSIVCKVEYGNTSFMLTGDAERTVEKELLRSGYDLSADVLKCGHHGSSSSNHDDFLDAVNPSVAVISCGKGNDYGHPHKEVLSSLRSRNIPIWRTDKEGTIVAASDGKDIYISSASNSPVQVTEPAASESEYIGNKNSKAFHLPDCSSVKDISDKNKVYLSSRQEAVSSGYKPCGNCHP